MIVLCTGNGHWNGCDVLLSANSQCLDFGTLSYSNIYHAIVHTLLVVEVTEFALAHHFSRVEHRGYSLTTR